MTSRLFRWRLNGLASQSGADLVSVYLAPSDKVATAVTLLNEAKAYADDGRPAERALEALGQYTDTDTAEHGLVLFADANGAVGFTDELRPSVSDTSVTIDDSFVVSPLETQRRFEYTIGLVVVERGDALIGELRHKEINRIKRKTGYVPSQHSAGGQSQQRFERRIEEQKDAFFESVIRRMKEAFVSDGAPVIDYLIIGGSSGTTREFAEALPPELQQHLTTTVSLDIADKLTTGTLEALYKQGRASVVKDERQEEFDAVERMRAAVGRGSPPTATTVSTVQQALEYHAVEMLLCTEEHDYNTLRDAQRAVQSQGGSFVLVETDWDGGAWMMEETDGFAALLRHEIH